MCKRILIILFVFTCANNSYADALYSILNSSRNIEGIEGHISNVAEDTLHSQLDIENLMKDLKGNTSGSSGWGTYQFHDYQSYGQGASNWADLSQTVKVGGGTGQLGQVVNAISREFPIDANAFSSGVTSPSSRAYYADQSQTIVAARAASQLDYDKVQDQITYQQMLQQQIEKTDNLKSAVDLNNRIQVEANLINLEILRQATISNQQQAITAQGGVNNALMNAKFLTKK